jgi:putative ABC transport system permease protein
MGTIISDVRYALRKLGRAPVFAAIAVATIALGIGANTAIFSVVYGVLVRPLPFERPDELVRVFTVIHGNTTWANSPSNFLELQQRAPSFSGLTMYAGIDQTLTGQGEPMQVQAAAVSASFFDVLGVRASLGRTFEDGENEPGRTDVVVVSHGLWQEQFGGDPAAIGQAIVLNGTTKRVVGVAPRGFNWPEGSRVWVPVTYTETLRTNSFGALSYNVVGRLRPGADIDVAAGEARAQNATLRERFPQMPEMSAEVTPLLETVVGSVRTPLLVLLASVSFVLLIACANIANLLLARATTREAEFAVRRALGAGRRRIVQQLLVESVILSLVGGVAGVLIALWATDALIAISPDGLPRVDEIRVDGVVLLFSMVAAVLTGLIFGVVPALHLARKAPAATLKVETRTYTGGSNNARSALVVAEMALAVVLLAGAGLLLNSFARLMAVEPGFDVDDAVAVQLWLPPADFAEWDHVRVALDRMIESTVGLPGVQAVGAVQTMPLAGSGMQLGVFVPTRPPATPDDLDVAGVRAVTPGFFRAAGVPLLSGRLFDETDRAGSQPVVLVNEAAARMLFGTDDPVGEPVQLTMNRDGVDAGGRVVGVVANTKVNALAEDAQPIVYLAFSQVPMRSMELVVRAGPGSMALAGGIRTEIQRVAPNLAINVRPLDYLVDAALAQARFYTIVLGAFAFAALVLAAVGIFGVFTFMVEQRRREIGIRLALGARQSSVVSMIVGRAGRLAAAGLVVGLAAAFALTRFLGGLLFGVGSRDPLTFIAVSALLAGVALLASYIPARGASRLDPLATLRAE